jgi:hypothetical protein
MPWKVRWVVSLTLLEAIFRIDQLKCMDLVNRDTARALIHYIQDVLHQLQQYTTREAMAVEKEEHKMPAPQLCAPGSACERDYLPTFGPSHFADGTDRRTAQRFFLSEISRLEGELEQAIEGGKVELARRHGGLLGQRKAELTLLTRVDNK